MKRIPYGRQHVTAEDIAAVEAVLRSDWLTQGPVVEAFESAVMSHCGARFAVAANSATSALHLACRALGLGPGDALWTSPITFIASANAALYCGAGVDFVDIDASTCNMSIDALSAKLKATARKGSLPKVVMPVHFGGQSCDMRAIGTLAKEYGFAVIEDASHAIGGRYRGNPVGNCEYSSIAVFSFHPVKIVTTGEGGMVVTNDAGIAERTRVLASHGVTRDRARMSEPNPDGWYYEQVELGYNYRLTDIQAALGASQMTRIQEVIAQRLARADRYDVLLRDLPAVALSRSKDAKSAWHLYVVQVEERRRVYDAMRAARINVNVHYIPVHLQPFYRRLGFGPGQFPNAEAYYDRALTLPLFPGLTFEQQDYVVATLREALP